MYFSEKLKMKRSLCCAISLLLVCVLVQVRGNCDYSGEILPVGTHYRNCNKVNCNEDGSMNALACPAWRCKEQIGYRELDLSKPYPECCEGPICKTD